MTIAMYDSVDLSQIPLDAPAVAAYVDGRFANYAEAKTRFPKASILSIAVFAADNADCLDIETGDATPAQAAGWVARQIARGAVRPCLYGSASTMGQILAAMKAAGVARNTLRLWSAHYTGAAHVCGPHSCGEMTVDADGTQWTDIARGKDLDESLLLDNFFGKAVTPPVVTYLTVATSLPVLTPGMSDANLPHWYIRRAQSIMNGVYGAGLTVDGEYGPATVTAVRGVQAHYGLAVDGITGSATWAKLVAG